MDNRSFDRLIRNASGISRRTTLMTLGAAGLVALAGPFAADAKKGGKKKHKHNTITPAPAPAPAPVPLECPPPAADLCPTQVNSCTTILTGQCGGDPVCTDTVACCTLLETCDASGFWACLLATSG